MFNDDMFFNKPLVPHGGQILNNFYSKRRSFDERNLYLDPYDQYKKQKVEKSRLTDEYIRLLKENTYLREFIKKNKLKIKDSKIKSTLDSLHSRKTGTSVKYHMDNLESKISKIFTYY